MSATPWYLKLVLRVAIPLACLGALYLSIPGEIAMARTAGWSEHYAYAMPVCVSVYALAAAAIAAYRRKMRLPGQWTALVGAVVALLLAMAAQSIAHLISQDYMGSSAVLVVAVSCVPPIVVAHLMHMAETPSQVKTASEEIQERDDMIELLRNEVASHLSQQADSLYTKSAHVALGVRAVTETAQAISQEVENITESLAAELEETEKEPKKVRAAVPMAAIQRAAANIQQQGEKVTGSSLAKALGVAESTGYRYKNMLTA